VTAERHPAPAPAPGSARALVQRAATPRAIALGLAAAVFVNFASPYTESFGFSNFSWSYLPEGGAFPFLLLLLLNPLLRALRPRWALTVPELLMVLVMALAANCTSLFLMYFLCAAIVSPHYFASPENRWADDLIPYLKPWLIVSDRNHAALWFYEGLPPGARIPWRDWLVPLAAWLPFLAAFLVASFALVAIMRRQWLENEKLSYPLMRIPLELVGRTPGRAATRPLFGNPAFWVGACVPLALGALDLTRALIPAFPGVTVDHLGSLALGTLNLGPHYSSMYLNLNFLALSSAFFVPSDVLFGVWSLYLLVKLVQEPFTNRLGLGAGSAGMFVWGQASTSWQSFGAFSVMVASILLSARPHLRRFWAQATGDGGGEEARSSRRALLALAAGVAVMAGWLVLSGMPGGIVTAFLLLAMLLYLGIARIICQTGIFYLVPPMIAQNPIIQLLGASNIGRQGMISLGLSYAWHGDVQTVMSGLAAEAMKIEEQAPLARGELAGGMLGAALVGLVVAPLGIILTGYPKGALAWRTWVFGGWGPNTFGQILGQISARPQVDYFPALYYSSGLAGMVLLTYLRSHFAWWPLHPIGLAAVSSFTIYAVYLPFLLGWAIKGALLRWGGYRSFRAATPLFIGLGVGHYLARALTLTGYMLGHVGWRI
jgi:hypothetical protein